MFRLGPRQADDAARLYEQGWPLARVARLFECDADAMRRILRTRLRPGDARPDDDPREEDGDGP